MSQTRPRTDWPRLPGPLGTSQLLRGLKQQQSDAKRKQASGAACYRRLSPQAAQPCAGLILEAVSLDQGTKSLNLMVFFMGGKEVWRREVPDDKRYKKAVEEVIPAPATVAS